MLVFAQAAGVQQSSADIAEALDTTVGNTDVLISRARDAFGDAYADVSELSRPCREAVAAIYREGGSGITPGEKAARSRTWTRWWES